MKKIRLIAAFLLAATGCAMPRINLVKRDRLVKKCMADIDFSQSPEDVEEDKMACERMANTLSTRRDPRGPTFYTGKTGLSPRIEK